MKLLVVTPDYASHYLPLAAVAGRARQEGVDVVVATGSTLGPRVVEDGFRWRPLRMSRGSNPGLLDRRSPVDAAADDLAGFFEATRLGMVATLRHQAQARGADLLWRPDAVARDVLALLAAEEPAAVLVDHLAFSTTLALRAAGAPFTTFVAGHPTQLPVAGEVYGLPPAWPAAIPVDTESLVGLRALCEDVRRTFTARYNDALAALTTGAEPVEDAFGAHGDDVLFNSPAALAEPGRVVPDRHAFLGSCVREEALPAEAAAWLDERGGDPFVYVSLGTFLSARDDVLRRIVVALAGLDVTVALSSGTTDPAALGPMPSSWLVAPSLPQVALLSRAAAVVTHGGNNTVTEALTAGCPLVVLPLSTDQFAVAADVERTGTGVALDPNGAGPADLAAAVATVLDTGAGVRRRVAIMADDLRRRPGPQVAVERLGLTV